MAQYWPGDGHKQRPDMQDKPKLLSQSCELGHACWKDFLEIVTFVLKKKITQALKFE